MPRCLVTGASGFIGPRMVRRLQQGGREVVCLVRGTSNTSRLEPLGVELREGDITRADSLPAALEGIDEVYHLAGKTHGRNLADYLEVNARGSANVAEACAARSNPPVLVAVSSLAAVGPSPAGGANDESVLPRPISNYGRSKLAGEVAVRRTAGDVPTTIVRPPVVFGPGDRDGLLVFKSIRAMCLHLVPQRQGLPMSLVHADDLCDAIALAGERGERLPASDAPANAESADPRGVYFAADPTPSSWADVGRMAAAAMGQRVWVLCRRKYIMLLPAMMGELKSRVTGRPSIVGFDKLREATATGWVCDVSKAERELGFSPAESLAERYRETCEWYRDAGWL